MLYSTRVSIFHGHDCPANKSLGFANGKNNVEPRCLADDLLFTASGSGHRARAIGAMKLSKKFFVDVGARVATNKCFMFATDSLVRSYLSTYHWDADGSKIPVCNNFRDLGSHLNLTCSNNGSTLTKRMQKAIKMLAQLGWMPISMAEKENIIRANILPMALYGCEAAHINEAVFEQLKAAIAKVIGPKSAKASTDIVFEFNITSTDLDPSVHVLYLRVASIRRIIAKHDGAQTMIARIIVDYLSHPNTISIANGPTGMLIKQLNDMHFGIGGDFVIRKANEPNIDLLEMPWQHLKKSYF